jgi:hypothetical protein
VEPVDCLGGRPQDRVDVLHDLVRRQPSPAPTEVHRAPRRQEAHPDLTRCLHLGGKQVAPAGGEHIVVIHRGGATGTCQPRQRGGSSGIDRFLVDTRPHRIERGEPAEQRGVDRESTGGPLVQVVVGVDESRRCQASGCVDVRSVVDVPTRSAGADRLDPRPSDHHVALGVLGAFGVHRDDSAGVDDDAVPRAHAGSPVIPVAVTRVAASRTASMIFS